MPRKKSAWIETVVTMLLCIFCSLSVGAWADLKVMGLSLMDFCDHLTANYLLPLGAMLACLFVGWYIPKKVVRSEFTNNGQLKGYLFESYLFAVRVVCPIGISLIFLHQLGIV